MTRPKWTKALPITIGLQSGVIVLASLLALLVGPNCARSLGAGGAAVVVPNAALAGYLWLRASQVRVFSAATFLVGEMSKLACTGVALYMVARWLGTTMVWPALVLGVILALKGQWLAVWFTRNV